MIQTIIKRDGRIVGFNEEKIMAAIRKAMLHTEKGEDEPLIRKITDRIACNGRETDVGGGNSGLGRNGTDEKSA